MNISGSYYYTNVSITLYVFFYTNEGNLNLNNRQIFSPAPKKQKRCTDVFFRPKPYTYFFK